MRGTRGLNTCDVQGFSVSSLHGTQFHICVLSSMGPVEPWSTSPHVTSFSGPGSLWNRSSPSCRYSCPKTSCWGSLLAIGVHDQRRVGPWAFERAGAFAPPPKVRRRPAPKQPRRQAPGSSIPPPRGRRPDSVYLYWNTNATAPRLAVARLAPPDGSRAGGARLTATWTSIFGTPRRGAVPRPTFVNRT